MIVIILLQTIFTFFNVIITHIKLLTVFISNERHWVKIFEQVSIFNWKQKLNLKIVNPQQTALLKLLAKAYTTN